MDEEQEKVQHSIADTPPGYKSWLRGEVAALLPVSETSAHNLAEDPGDGSVAHCTCGWVAEFAPTWGRTTAYSRYLERAEAHIAHARALEHAQRDKEAYQAAERAARAAKERDEIRQAYQARMAKGFTGMAGLLLAFHPWLKDEVLGPPAPIVPLEHQPRRGDAVEAWLMTELADYPHGKVGPETDVSHETVAGLLEHYQQLADEGTPMRAVVQEN